MPAPPLPYPTLSPIRLEPTEGGTDEFPGAFGGCPCRAFNFATSAASASTSSINCSRLNSANASRPIGAATYRNPPTLATRPIMRR
jgi:hypothetical protein